MTYFKKYQWWIRSSFAVLCTFIIFVIALMLQPGNQEADDRVEGDGSHYFRLHQDNYGVIVFVHGVLGAGKSTWTNPRTNAYWPDLLTKDSIFANYNIYVYEYPSQLVRKSYTLDELTDNMRLVLEDADVLNHNELIFLSHSMGGLVTRGFLIKYHELIPKVGFIYFFLHQRRAAIWRTLQS